MLSIARRERVFAEAVLALYGTVLSLDCEFGTLPLCDAMTDVHRILFVRGHSGCSL